MPLKGGVLTNGTFFVVFLHCGTWWVNHLSFLIPMKTYELVWQCSRILEEQYGRAAAFGLVETSYCFVEEPLQGCPTHTLKHCLHAFMLKRWLQDKMNHFWSIKYFMYKSTW
jgi:hypothetical protein